MDKNYPKDKYGGDMTAAKVYELVGGNVYKMYLEDPISYSNACALRVSYALNQSGFKIPYIKNKTFQGGDGNYYFLGASSLKDWLQDNVRAPDLAPKKDFQSINGNRGIYIMIPNYPGKFGASGHATLFNGSSCIGGIGHCYLNAEGGVYQVHLWILK